MGRQWGPHHAERAGSDITPGHFSDTSPALRPAVRPDDPRRLSPVRRSAPGAPRSVGASTRTAVGSGDSTRRLRRRLKTKIVIPRGWDEIYDLPEGFITRRITDDTLPEGLFERTIVYHAPFDHCDRSRTIDSPGPSSAGDSSRDEERRLAVSSSLFGDNDMVLGRIDRTFSRGISTTSRAIPFGQTSRTPTLPAPPNRALSALRCFFDHAPCSVRTFGPNSQCASSGSSFGRSPRADARNIHGQRSPSASVETSGPACLAGLGDECETDSPTSAPHGERRAPVWCPSPRTRRISADRAASTGVPTRCRSRFISRVCLHDNCVHPCVRRPFDFRQG